MDQLMVRSPWKNIFENPEELTGSSADLMTLYDRCVNEGIVPELYQACGTEDFLYEMNKEVRK
ncbi:hypothetical protein [Lacrimispora xylanisolvens]|uniref:hypothetical protein n=1 Tax=Lacrimispora xylanisolvens TaxID=384636 RepID=UPI002402C457